MNAALHGELSRLAFEHFDGGRVQCRQALHAELRFVVFPTPRGLRPEKRAEKEEGRELLADRDALVRALQRHHEEALPLGIRHDALEHRKEFLIELFVAKLLHAVERMPAGEDLEEFVHEAGLRNVAKQHAHLSDRPLRRGIDLKAQLRGDAHRADHAHGVFAVALFRSADHAEALRLDVVVPAVVVEELFGLRVVIERIAGEVAARRILPHFAEFVVGDDAARRVLRDARARERAEGRAFDHFVAEHHVHEPEAPSDDDAAAHRALHFFGTRVGDDVEVLGRDAQKKVAHGPAHDVGAVSAGLKLFAGLFGLPGDERGIDPVFVGADYAGLLDDAFVRLEKGADPVNEGFDHWELLSGKSRRTCQPRSRATARSASSGCTA